MTPDLTPQFGYVLFSVSVNVFIYTMMASGKVIQARKDFGVKLPSLYATPGFHKEADAFNRVQRGHQSTLETLSGVQAMALVGGVFYPIWSAAAFNVYLLGCFLFQVGYADVTLDVKDARYRKGGLLKWIGILSLLALSGMSSAKWCDLL